MPPCWLRWGYWVPSCWPRWCYQVASHWSQRRSSLPLCTGRGGAAGYRRADHGGPAVYCRAGHSGATGYRRAGHGDVSSIVVLVSALLLATTVCWSRWCCRIPSSWSRRWSRWCYWGPSCWPRWCYQATPYWSQRCCSHLCKLIAVVLPVADELGTVALLGTAVLARLCCSLALSLRAT